ncbi:pleckstrin homology domain-containing family O member 2 isoform X2 [Cyclopterus lumpus]|uniref:pleckstrin homology domain-containing family O member 2 isoform X2 n=1 Tax=Cyclopterus lumpus TaxID=8103 RepID=UPI0014871671|nr:pleckstrin homology domain-containing family O member 2 isoform X2 [Cyclopterus lumpus]
MEDGAKEDPAQSKEPKFLGKAGWVKKAPGRLLASYKDRFVHVEKTEIVVYENENRQNCLERLDLENYDKCHELKSPFKKKHRLVLIRSPKPGNKVHDVKFQAQTAEEKEAWIKALIDGINRAKNKIFDEVADVSSDGILRLDLDLENAIMPNGTHHAPIDGTETLKEAIKAPTPPSNASESAEKQTAEEEAPTEPQVSPQRKVFKPPMPPTKESKSCSTLEDQPDKDDDPVKKVKEAKPCASHVEDTTEEVKVENVEKSPDARKKTGPPPTPPNKPSSSDSLSNLAEASQSRPNSHPPTPPSKEKKPSNPAVESDQEAPSTADENMGKEEGGKEEAAETTEETDEVDQSISKEAPPSVGEESPDAEGQVSEGESEETMGSDESKACDNEPQIPTETLGSSPSPLLLHKKKPEKPAKPDTQDTGDNATIMQIYEGQDPTALLPTGLDTSASSPRAEEALAKSEVRSVLVYLNDPVSDSLSLSPLLCHLPGEKKKKTEEKSVDSGQHSDVDSEGSGNEDTLAVSTAALRGSHPGLDVFDTSEGDIQIPVSSRPTKAPPKPQVRPKVFPCRRSGPTPPLKPSTKARSASIGDLLSDSSVCVEAGQHTSAVAGGDVVMKLETEVALEMEKTRELLSKVSQAQGEGDREGKTEDLLAKAMEKLKKADYVLKEVKKLKIANNLSNRKSW